MNTQYQQPQSLSFRKCFKIFPQFNFESIIFPGSSSIAPFIQSPIRKHNSFKNHIDQEVPYLQISNQQSLQKKKAILYFHGNAENIYQCHSMMETIFKSLKITIFIIQYPGYGYYKRNKKDKLLISERIKQNSLEFIRYLEEKHMIDIKDINIIGRSIGSGPATCLAARIQSQKLVLISPFDSIKNLASSYVWGSSHFVFDHFNNTEQIRKYRGDLLVIHGKRDNVINIQHGRAVYDAYKQYKEGQIGRFQQREYMSHNYFTSEDVKDPIKKFLTEKEDIKQSPQTSPQNQSFNFQSSI